MPDKTSENPFDLMQAFLPKWPQAPFSNWAFAEREDRLEERAFSGLQRFNKSLWDRTEKAFEDHMSFVSNRIHEDFECAKALSECRMPDEAFATLQNFYTRMSDEYQKHAMKQVELFQEGMSEGMAAAEELGETALETATEMGRATEESLEEAQKKTAPRTGRKTKTA